MIISLPFINQIYNPKLIKINKTKSLSSTNLLWFIFNLIERFIPIAFPQRTSSAGQKCVKGNIYRKKSLCAHPVEKCEGRSRIPPISAIWYLLLIVCVFSDTIETIRVKDIYKTKDVVVARKGKALWEHKNLVWCAFAIVAQTTRQ